MTMNASRAASLFFRRLSTATATATATKTKNPAAAATATATETVIEAARKESWASRNKERSLLYSRLAALGGSDLNAGDTINEWVKEGKSVKKSEIIGFVNELRKYKRHHHCIQLLEWLDKEGLELSHGEQAIRLDLIAKTKGVDSAEKYFRSLPESSKTKYTYGALLNCYCKAKMTAKAMDLLEKMRELKFASTSLAYNNIISLHMRLGEPEKVPPLVQEMKEKSITPDSHTYSFLMNSYALMKDIEKAEGIIEEMAKDGVKRDYSIYANLASIYVKAGLFDKANSTLKEIEKMQGLDRKGYYILMGLYSHTSNRLGVERVWGALKSVFPKLINGDYLSKLQALNRVGDSDGLMKCFEEWESGCTRYDIRLANVIMDHYLNKDMIKDAEDLLESAYEKGRGVNFRTLEMFMDFYLKQRQVDSALKCLETAASILKDGEWKPSEDVVCTFMKCMKDEKDVDRAENLVRSLKKFGSVNSDVYEFLMQVYVDAEEKEPTMRERMKEDGIEMKPRLKKLIGKVCPL